MEIEYPGKSHVRGLFEGMLSRNKQYSVSDWYAVHGPELPPMFGPNLPKRTLEPTDKKTKFDLGKLKTRSNPLSRPALVTAEEEEEMKKPKKKRLELPLPG